jgi:diacylglycerol kinase family enzyme
MSSARFAVYLNSNARRVSPDVVERIEELVHPDDIFTSDDPQSAYGHAACILDRQYPTVFVGGGDGTVVQLVNALHAEAGRRPDLPPVPTLGVLSLGTGNALSRLVSSGSAIQDLKSYVVNPSHDVWSISLVSWEGRVFPFGSLGVDAEILADYAMVRDGPVGKVLKPLFQNVGGYFVSFFTATTPRHVKAALRREHRTVRITSLGDRAAAIGNDGEPTRTWGPGEVIYEGPANAVITGTVPIYGYGLRILPFADRQPDFFQLRVSRIHLLRAFVNLDGIWNGTYRNEDLIDHYVQHVRVELSSPMPFQIGGDYMGERDTLELELAPRRLRLLRFI